MLNTNSLQQHTSYTSNLSCVNLGTLLKTDYEDPEVLLGKLITSGSIGFLAGPRGGGKTWLALLIAYAVAGGKKLSPWGTGGKASVVYLDGEMRARELKERLRLIDARNSKIETKVLAAENLKIISRDVAGSTIGYIDTDEGRKAIDALIPLGTKFLIIDNKSSWTSGGSDDGSTWAGIQTWLIEKRLAGIAVLVIHHTGKNGTQRGTSAHEDLMDFSVILKTLESDPDKCDTRFSITHTKLREFHPELRRIYSFSISTTDGKLDFECNIQKAEISDRDAMIIQLNHEGVSGSKIAEELGISTSTVSRVIKKNLLLEKQES
jgi:RecA-family ATPase